MTVSHPSVLVERLEPLCVRRANLDFTWQPIQRPLWSFQMLDPSFAAIMSFLKHTTLVYTGSPSLVTSLGTFDNLVVVELDIANAVLSHRLDYHSLEVDG